MTALVQVPRANLEGLLSDLAGVCVFWACPGPAGDIVPMATCTVCATHIRITQLLTGGETP